MTKGLLALKGNIKEKPMAEEGAQSMENSSTNHSNDEEGAKGSNPVESSTKPTTYSMPPLWSRHGDNGEATHGASVNPVGSARGSILLRTESAPSSLETTERVSPQESGDEETGGAIRVVPKDASQLPNEILGLRQKGQTHTGVSAEPEMPSEEFEDFLNSPKGQNAIVERSPSGRYIRFLEKLGSGASKDVYRAYDTAEGIEVAWNVVNLAGVPKTERSRIVNEVRLLERLHHENIISFHGSWVNRERREVIFATEILSSGTLKSFIEKVQVIRWKIAKRWAIQILKGLEYLHSQDPPVIHRDLKCENIFINGASSDLRIGDLGLSTVHTNGRVLSVLGTPEFMAPDLYEESAYDEKVDIYAFGMCLLEIFTKEIPYRECSNVAQIYKKVMHGELPKSLSRLKSQEARDFIMLCLGHKDETGKYVRPSASQLLKHTFLEKGPNDDKEVEVAATLQETVVPESSVGDEMENQKALNLPELSKAPIGNGTIMIRSSRRNEQEDVDDGKDQFDEMADRGTNLQEVKVTTGREEELKHKEKEGGGLTLKIEAQPTREATPVTPHSTHETTTLDLTTRSTTVDQAGVTEKLQPLAQAGGVSVSLMAGASSSSEPTLQAGTSDVSQSVQTQVSTDESRLQTSTEEKQYLIAAAVIEDESPLVQPYADEILKLIITLPVDGQTQNVQFDFHLVEDDPVQVAREMVSELGIPQDAVLEISGTVSALARQARMKQEKYHSRKRQLEQTALQQNTNTVDQRPTTIQSSATALPTVTTAPSVTEPVLSQISQHQASQVTPIHALQSPFQTGTSSAQAQRPHPTASVPPQSASLAAQGSQQVAVSTTGSSQQTMSQSVPVHHIEMPSVSTIVHSHVAGPSSNVQPQSFASVIPGTASLSRANNVPLSVPSQSSFPASDGVTDQPVQAMKSQHQRSHSMNGPNGVHAMKTPTGESQISQVPQSLIENQAASFGNDHDTEDEDAGEIDEEMRKLHEEYEKSIVRADKVFRNRMDNLERSKKEKEVQHQKTLEKHEKDRLEYEKRVKQEAIVQKERLEQIKREHDRKRELLAKKQAQASAQNLQTDPQETTVFTDAPAQGAAQMPPVTVSTAQATASLQGNVLSSDESDSDIVAGGGAQTR